MTRLAVPKTYKLYICRTRSTTSSITSGVNASIHTAHRSHLWAKGDLNPHVPKDTGT